MKLSHLDVLGGITLLESVVNAYEYAPHWHEEYVFAIYRGGVKQFTCGRDQGIAKPKDILLIAPGTIHSAKAIENFGWDYISLYLSPETLTRVTGLEQNSIAKKIHQYVQLSNNHLLTNHFFDACDAGNAMDIALSDWLINVLTSTTQERTDSIKIPSNLVLVYELIMDDPTQQITMEGLSRLADVTPEHLSRSFKKFYGLPPFQLIIAARIQAARKLAINGVPLADAAISAGFADQSHMTRWIKRAFGVSSKNLLKYQ